MKLLILIEFHARVIDITKSSSAEQKYKLVADGSRVIDLVRGRLFDAANVKLETDRTFTVFCGIPKYSGPKSL